MHGRAAKPKRTTKKLNENQNKETNSGEKTVEKSGEKGEYYSFLSAFDWIIILINSVYYVFSALRLYSILRWLNNLNENTHTLDGGGRPPSSPRIQFLPILIMQFRAS